MELRLAIEPSIAAHAASRAHDEHIEELATLVEESVVDPDDIEGIVARDMEFHNVLTEAADNPLYSIVLGSVTELQLELRRKLAVTQGGRNHGIAFHRRILDAVRAREPDQARTLMSEHLKAVADDLRLAIEKPEESSG